jgi:DNA-directed RNA polymerase subunit RPC12/RpoP
MPIYKCPKCGRTVEKPEGEYYCSVCGPEVLMIPIESSGESSLKMGVRLCGDSLERWLTDRGLSYLDAKDVIIGIPDFKSTTLALDYEGKIVDYDQYYEDAERVLKFLGRRIWERLQRQAREGIIRTPEKVLVFKNIPPDCLECYGTVTPYI